MRPPTPSLVTSLPSMLLKPLQLSIVALSIALSYFSATYPTSVPPPQFSFAFVIPLLWILPIYFLVTFISPILLCCQSTYGRRPTWLSPKERYFTLFLPAFATLGWAVYRLITITDNGGFDDYQQRDFGGYQWNVLPSLCLALSTLVFIETYITYRLDMRPSLHQQAPSATCGKLFCLHKCVTTMALKTPSGTPPIDSTYCSSVRLIRNVSAVATIVGTVVLLNIIGLMVLVDEYSSYWFSRCRRSKNATIVIEQIDQLRSIDLKLRPFDTIWNVENVTVEQTCI
ncbi:hypothetical protein BKA57DRAFT_494182 [Linnemannia elongata]|nr:hypothetical protein BKA57DRAFT_494182 [Linnemannia elongata]